MQIFMQLFQQFFIFPCIYLHYSIIFRIFAVEIVKYGLLWKQQ